MANLERAVHVDTVPECFPSAQAYHANSVVSMMNSQSLPLLRILKHSKSVAQLEVAMLLFLERSSAYDWKLRLEYLNSLVDSVLTNGSAQCQSDVPVTLKSFLHSFGALFSSDLMKNLTNEVKDLRSTQFG